jgi:hypothetical protein
MHPPSDRPRRASRRERRRRFVRVALAGVSALGAVACTPQGPETAPAAVEAGALRAGATRDAATVGQHGSSDIASVRLGGSNATGGVDLVCTPDGAANATYFNRGFSSAGGEVYTHPNHLGRDKVDAIWRAAKDLAAAPTWPADALDGGPDQGSVTIRFSDGKELRAQWSGDRHPDPRVAALASLLKGAL